jgi:hypothetical protein
MLIAGKSCHPVPFGAQGYFICRYGRLLNMLKYVKITYVHVTDLSDNKMEEHEQDR